MKKKVMLPSIAGKQTFEEPSDANENQDSERDTSIDNAHEGEELDGNMLAQPDDTKEKLAHTALDVDTSTIDDGMVVQEGVNQNVGSFMPDIMCKDLVNNYKNAKQLYGETIIRELTGYDPRYVEKNITIPEFQRELQERVRDAINDLKDKEILTPGGRFSDSALDVAALFLLEEEYEQTQDAKSPYGEHVNKALDRFGEKNTTRPYIKSDSYKDVAIRKSISKAISRNHDSLETNDLVSFDRRSKEQINIIYALDTSGSMKGTKIKLAKKAGVSLARKAISDQNKVGTVLFGSDVKSNIPLTNDLLPLLRSLVKASPGRETDIGLAIDSSIELLDSAKGIKHVVIITDGLHTTTNDPKESIQAKVHKAKEQNISISIVGIELDDKGLELAQSIVDHSGGNLHSVKELDAVGGIVIADYADLL
ncbi:MAG: vWA domain-containing protein [Nanobdellota archaeon]